ncbi:MAG: hypothetical protein K2L54_02045 [Clostridiales bacterium]|nr:hypothetical protein [Clostridiales bacterium]
MGFCFSSPDKKEILKENRELVEDNARILCVCKDIAVGEIKDRVAQAYDRARYIVPTVVVGAMQIDKKINALAGDLKIALSKGKERGLLQAEEIVKDLEIAFAERNSYN